MDDAAVLERFQRWFESQCDDDWEHGNGIRIETLDNPGWFIRIYLEGTDVASKPFTAVEIDRTDEDWLRLWIEDEVWTAATGPLNLSEALASFLAWADG